MSIGEQVRASVFLVLGGVCGALGMSLAEREPPAAQAEAPVEPPPPPPPPPLVLNKECTDTRPEVCRYFDPRDGTVCYTVVAGGHYNVGISCIPERP